MSHTSRTKTILGNEELSKLKSLIELKSSKINFGKKHIYLTPIGGKTDEGMIPEKQKGQLSAYLWDRKIKRGSISMNMQIINGYEDPLFNDENKVKIYYEIFPSASENPRDSKIFNTFKKEQNTIKADNFVSVKKVISRIFKRFRSRK